MSGKISRRPCCGVPRTHTCSPDCFTRAGKERGILFCKAMVRAQRLGLKTQTRRVADFNEPESIASGHGNDGAKQFAPRLENGGVWKAAHAGYECRCPYGVVGDILYVKETFTRTEGREAVTLFREDPMYDSMVPGDCAWDWTPSIFMKREYARTRLKVTEVRVERVQDITEADAIAEGCEMVDGFPKPQPDGQGEIGWDCAVDWYRDLWNDINALPKPVYVRDEENGERVLEHYVAYPWSEDDFYERLWTPRRSAEANAVIEENAKRGRYRGHPLIVIPNPYVWAITFQPKP